MRNKESWQVLEEISKTNKLISIHIKGNLCSMDIEGFHRTKEYNYIQDAWEELLNELISNGEVDANTIR